MKRKTGVLLGGLALLFFIAGCGEEKKEISEETVIVPASTYQQALDLHDQAFNQHDFRYLKVACIEPCAKEYMGMLLNRETEEEYWEGFDERQGDYFGVGVFEGYSSKVTGKEKLENIETVEEEISSAYGYSCIVQDAYELTYDWIASGTEGSTINEGYRVQVVKIEDAWYISDFL